ncbi:hypothetical protein EVAR_61354_1 [Eumeta japonica]|uniref:Uncharacterized protein n=1 Tax=Eumeta variegata TaxID=151549 RepID=A0A4C1ZP77_EUMVA|nr:hypothetical protein EVAR_61354_1 [Eumeta japonica]
MPPLVCPGPKTPTTLVALPGWMATDRVWNRYDSTETPRLSLFKSLMMDFVSLPHGRAVSQATGIKNAYVLQNAVFQTFLYGDRFGTVGCTC